MFKPGDTVVIVIPYGRDKTKDPRSYGYYGKEDLVIKVDNNTVYLKDCMTFSKHRLVLKEIFESPLYQALKEE